MCDYNLKVKVWSRNDDIRVYLDGKFVEYRSIWSHANAYFYRKDDGSIGWRHGFRTGPETMRKAEMCAMAVEAIMGFMRCDGMTFEELLNRISQCQTKGGNFSVRQYEKAYVLPSIKSRQTTQTAH